MGFRYPGSDVAFCTALWMLLAGFGIWMGLTTGQMPWYMAVVVATGIAGLGMWFQVRSAGYIFGGVNALLTIIGIIGLFVIGFSPRSAMKIAGNLYAAWTAFQWSASRDTTA